MLMNHMMISTIWNATKMTDQLARMAWLITKLVKHLKHLTSEYKLIKQLEQLTNDMD